MSDIDSTVDAHVKAMTVGESGQRYILAHERHYTLSEMFRMLSEISGIASPGLKLPAKLVRASSIVNEAVLGLLGLAGRVSPIIESEIVRYFMLDAQYDSRLARKVFGFQERDFREVLKDEVAWYVKNGYVKRSSKIIFYRKIGKLKR